ncbi:DUF2989 domain-containing protein [uncultured Paraglaciecola sp.]|uniref:DUF2989 domain-containing protein n=1 Tax=uncultured Paraglaciecola sp. TaxID=1765024 RepID=UPI0030D8595C|tara:strand:+ start:54 stop:839 length:786 start_codon:yes stop_codon:yes gene_type:complete
MRIAGILLLMFATTGCDVLFPMTAEKICKEHTEFCADLNPDGWCLAEKSRIIKHRYAYQQSPSELIDFYLLEDFEKYKVCINNAAQIEHIVQIEKQTRRREAAVSAERELNRLIRKTQHSHEPHLLLYHWSRFGKKEALKEFLLQENQGKLNTPSLQLGLASYYVKFDLEKAKNALYQALSLYNQEDEIDTEIFISLSTINLKQENYPEAYVWAFVANEFKVANVNLVNIKQTLPASSNLRILEERAEQLVDNIEQRTFSH